MKNTLQLLLFIIGITSSMQGMRQPPQGDKLHAAAEKAAVNQLDTLLKDDTIDVNSQDLEGKTALHKALAGDKPEHFKVAQTLIANDKIKALPDNEGNTILHAAITPSGHYFYARLLDTLGKKGLLKSLINAQNKQGRTPLQVAIERNEKDIVLALLAAGALVNTQDNDGNTPLHKAVEQNVSMPIVQALLEKDATVMNNKNKAGLTPLQVLQKAMQSWEEYAAVNPSAQSDVARIKEVAALFGHSGDASPHVKDLKKPVVSTKLTAEVDSEPEL